MASTLPPTSDQRSRAGSPSESPPPITRGHGRTILLLAAGAVTAIILAVVVFNIDRGDETLRQERAQRAFDDASAPPPSLGIENPAAAADRQRDTDLITTVRGWIQTTEEGRLAQEYRYARSEPAPGGRLRMTEPEVKIYLGSGRALTMRGDAADVHAPNKALESGTMTGKVLIRMYELEEGQLLDESSDIPVLEVRTPEASFDNFQGEIRCPYEVDIQTATAHLPGVGLRLQINDIEGRPGHLMIDRINGELRLAEGAAAESTPRSRETEVAEADVERVPADASVTVVGSDDSDVRGSSSRPRRDAPPRTGMPAEDRVIQRQHERAAERRQARGATPSSSRDGPHFYRLTLSQNVYIRQGDGSQGWNARGDQLHIVFSLDSDDLKAAGPNQRKQQFAGHHAHPMTLEAHIAMLAVATLQEPSIQPHRLPLGDVGLFKPSDTDTVITCDGPLSMVPLINRAEFLDSPDDSRFELIGSPVVLVSAEDQTDIRCAMMRYASLSEVMELIGSAQHRLVITSPELHAECDNRFVIDRLNGVGAFEGAGWMIAGEADDELQIAAQPLVDRGEIRIAWKQGVDLRFEQVHAPRDSDDASAGVTAHDSFGRLRLAVFNGEVAVRSDDFTLDAERMSVGFPAARAVEVGDKGEKQRLASIDFIHAERSVRAGSIGEDGSIDCRDLHVTFAIADGRTVPSRMVAEGDVKAIDHDNQTMWADTLEVAFRSRGGGERASAVESSQSSNDRRADVESLVATGSVQIRLADGARAFADRLDSDGDGTTIVLTGEDVLVVSDRSIISHGTRLELTSKGDDVLWPGPGEFAYHTTPILGEQVGLERITRPQVDETINPRQMSAKWNENMAYDGLANDGAGVITIRGQVNTESAPSELELNTMQSNELTLHFANVEKTDDPESGSDPQVQRSDSGMFAMEQRGKQLSKLIAIGDARLESRTWVNADHSDLPRVFYLNGPHIEYDDQTLDASVFGAGELLIRDERPADQQEAANETATAVGNSKSRRDDMPFSARGTTLFKWQDRLTMTRQQRESTLYDINFVGGVEVIHRALDGSISTMTGQMLAATVDRIEGASERDAGFDLGGSMDLRRIHARGDVYVDSPTRDIDCDEFDFDYITGLAQLIAHPGRRVTIVTAGNPHPVQAELFQWNTVDDTVVVKKASGSGGS